VERFVSLFGLLAMIFLAWLLSERRRAMNLRLIASGVALQFLLAVFLLRSAPGRRFFDAARWLITRMIDCADAGAMFVFGRFFWDAGHFPDGPPFFITVLPMVIFFSSLTAVLFHLGVLQWVVKVMARVMVWVMDASGSESVSAAANVFVGMTTAPLTIRPYLASMTRSEIMAMMTVGMATVAGSVMPAYVRMGADAGHLLVASLISAPAGLVIAKIMVPETEDSPTKGVVRVEVTRQDANLLDAACRGAGEGLKLALNIAAMLIAFLALVALLNWVLGGLSEAANWGLGLLGNIGGEALSLQRLVGVEHVSLQWLLGWLLAPMAWLLGVAWEDAPSVGMLLGEKTIFNEFVAYQHLTSHEVRSAISPRSFTIATYALCGFANFGSIAVMIGGIGAIIPERRQDIARYGFRSLIGGTLAAFMTAAIAGILI
jgi:concentrative nucleoside transporter, CNT family